jgi:hypothetical protein
MGRGARTAMSEPKKVIPMGGLCNRLRVILSYRALYGEIEVLWARSTGVCRGSFLDAFEPLSGVTFTDMGDGLAQDLPQAADRVGPVSSASFVAPPSWPLGYMQLRPRAHVMDRVDELDEMDDRGPNRFAAIHARHSDHDENAARFGHVTTNEELLAWYHESGEGRPLYLASECKKTQEWFRARLPAVYANRAWTHQVHHYDERPGTISDAVVDLYICVRAAAFKGTWISSFSETVSLMRCGGAPEGGYIPHVHMPSTDAEYYRGRADLAEAWIREHE